MYGGFCQADYCIIQAILVFLNALDSSGSIIHIATIETCWRDNCKCIYRPDRTKCTEKNISQLVSSVQIYHNFYH